MIRRNFASRGRPRLFSRGAHACHSGSRAVCGWRSASIDGEEHAQNLIDILMRDGGNAERRAFGGAFEPRHLRLQGLGIDRIDLRKRDDLRLLRQARAIGFKLAPHGLIGLARVRARRIDEMQQNPAAFDMAEETVAEAKAFMRAFDEAGNVGENEFASVAGNDAELRIERGEGIIGDLRLGGGDGREKGRFAGIGQADQAGVGDELQAQSENPLLRLLAGIDAARRLVRRGLEMRIAEAAVAAAREAHALSDLGQIGEQMLALEDLGADRHFQDRIGAFGAGAVLAHAVAAGLRLEMLLIAVIDERIQAIDAERDDIAAAPAVAAVRAAEFDEFLAPKRKRSGAAGAGSDIDLGLVEEFHRNFR